MNREVTASAPGRVNLIGEHLDYNGGLCLPVAIDRRTTARVRRGAGRILSAHPGAEPYVLGVLAALGVTEALDVDLVSAVPVGAGLSSSAALTCSVATAVNELLDLGLDRAALLAATVRAENEFVGVPTGGMDQSVALYAETGTALLLDFASGARTAVPWAPTGVRLQVIDTGVRHALADSAYAERRATCEAAARELGLTALAAASAVDVLRLRGVTQRRARHVITEQQRVREFAAAAAEGDWPRAGRLMTASHVSLRDDYEVSCAELDAAVEDALAAGALGARMTGGGFGGCAIALFPDGSEAPAGFPVEASHAASVDAVS